MAAGAVQVLLSLRPSNEDGRQAATSDVLMKITDSLESLRRSKRLKLP